MVIRRIILSLSLLTLGFALAASCAQARDEAGFTAESANGHVHFFLSDATAHRAFDAYCDSRPANTCDEFDQYDIDVNFDDQVFGLTFIHRDPESAPSEDGVTIVCAYALRDRLECASGLQ